MTSALAGADPGPDAAVGPGNGASAAGGGSAGAASPPPGAPTIEELRHVLLELVRGHNLAALAGATVAFFTSLGLLVGALFAARLWPPLAAVPGSAAVFLVWSGLRLYGRVVRDLGPGRQAAAEVAARLAAAPRASLTLRDLEAALPRPTLLRGLRFLGKMGLVGPAPAPDPADATGTAAADPALVLDAARLGFR